MAVGDGGLCDLGIGMGLRVGAVLRGCTHILTHHAIDVMWTKTSYFLQYETLSYIYLRRSLGRLPSSGDLSNLLNIRDGEERRGGSGGSGVRNTAAQNFSSKLIATWGVTSAAPASTFRRVGSYGCLSLVRVGSIGNDLSRLGSGPAAQEVVE